MLRCRPGEEIGRRVVWSCGTPANPCISGGGLDVGGSNYRTSSHGILVQPPVAESFTKDRNHDVRKSQKYQMNVKIWTSEEEFMYARLLTSSSFAMRLCEALARASCTAFYNIAMLNLLVEIVTTEETMWWLLSLCSKGVCVCVSEPHQSVMKEFLKIKRKFHAGPSSLRGRTRSQAPFNLL